MGAGHDAEAWFHPVAADSVALIGRLGLRFAWRGGLPGIHNILPSLKSHSCGRFHLPRVSEVGRDSNCVYHQSNSVSKLVA